MEKSRGYFPLFTLQYQDRWKIFHAIGLIGGKFSIYQQCYAIWTKAIKNGR
jgi:hypothetical protein